MNTDPLDQKAALRAPMRERLAQMDAADRAARSRKIVDALVQLPTFRAAATVLLYAPLPVEPDLDLLWGDGALAGKQCAYPRVEGIVMRLYFVNSPAELEPTRWGLREPIPVAAREADLADFDLVLVPGIAFDEQGGRLGRGGGFYDRLLAKRTGRTTALGVGFAFQYKSDPLPRAPHDVRMNGVCVDA